MTKVLRLDKSRINKAVKLDNGFLKAPGYITRAGVFTYTSPDGKKSWNEYRPAEEVFSEEAMASFALMPVTYEHPLVGAVTAENSKDLAVGSVGEDIHKDGNFVAATMMVTDAKTVSAIEKGKVELSCGYYCDRIEEPGEYQGIKYQYVQKNIVGNHVALTSHGRAGPDVRLRLDSEAAINIEGVEIMERLKLDGVDYEVSTTAAQAFEKVIAASKLELDKVAAKADTLESQNKALAEKLTEVTSPKYVAALVASRVALEGKAKNILGEGFKADSLTDHEVRAEAVKKAAPELKLDGKSEDYVAAAFDTLTVSPIVRNPAAEEIKEKITTDSVEEADSKAAFLNAIYKR